MVVTQLSTIQLVIVLIKVELVSTDMEETDEAQVSNWNLNIVL